MTVQELITKLSKLPATMEIMTNQCQATSMHEDVTEDVIVGTLHCRAYIGSPWHGVEPIPGSDITKCPKCGASLVDGQCMDWPYHQR